METMMDTARIGWWEEKIEWIKSYWGEKGKGRKWKYENGASERR